MTIKFHAAIVPRILFLKILIYQVSAQKIKVLSNQEKHAAGLITLLSDAYYWQYDE